MTRPIPPMSRRSALTLLAGAAPLIVAPRVLGADGTVAPSRRITMGFIGLGVHGLGYNLANFLQHDDAQIVAVCDVFASRRRKARETVDAKYGTQGCREYADFRELLADPGIDAVCISTPDHWHVPIAMMALEAGKDVMCEKPTLTIAEGRALVEKVAAKKAVYQVGLEDRSTSHYHKLAQLVRNGAVGDLRRITAGLPSGKPIVVVETGYPWRPHGETQHMDWPMTPAGQREFLLDLIETVRATPDQLGRGVIWWYPEAIRTKGLEVWKNGDAALFDAEGHALPALQALTPR